MSALLFRQSKSKPIAIVDIQTGSVSMAIVLPQKGAQIRVLAHEKTDLSFEDRTAEATAAALAGQIDEVGKKIIASYAEIQKKYGSVTQTYVVINTPLMHSETTRIVSSFEKETLITQGMIAEMAKKAFEEGKDTTPSDVLEASIIRVELNGYVTAHPEGKHALKISVYAIVSRCDPSIRVIVQESLQKIFAVPIVFRSQLRTILSVVGATASFPSNYCVIDITRESTTIANIHTGLSVGNATINEGLLSITKRIAGNGMIEETLGLLHMVTDDTCTSSVCTTIHDAVTKAEPDLVRVFATEMVSLVSSRYLPTTLILLCDDVLTPWFTELFSRIDFTQFTTTTQPFEVRAFDMSSLGSFLEPVSGTPLPMRLALAAALVHIESQDNLHA